jgi:hypothetical protein
MNSPLTDDLINGPNEDITCGAYRCREGQAIGIRRWIVSVAKCFAA